MLAEVQSKHKDCNLMDMSKCLSTSRNQLGRSAYFKILNLSENRIRFSFHFFIGLNRDLGLCSVRVASKLGKERFADKEKVMSYLPIADFDNSHFST